MSAARRGRSCPHEVAVTAGVVIFILFVAGSPAAAHGDTGSDASNFLITITAAGDDGLDWQIYGGDALLELTNRTGQPVTVLGYEDEPYLRFVPSDGVYENIRSPATYLNRERTGTVGVPAEANADAPPEWQRITTGDTYGWHDHRAHWMNPDLPPAVVADPDRQQQISSWTIAVQIDGPVARSVEAAGTLSWVPPAPAWPPIVIVGLAFATLTAIAVALTQPGPQRWPGLARTVAALVLLVVAANLIRTIDDATASAADTGQHAVLVVVAVLALACVAGLAIAGSRGSPAGFLALGAAGLLTALLFATGSSDQLTASQLVTGLPTWVRRATVAASYLIVIPASAAAVIALRRYSRNFRPVTDTEQPVPASTAPAP